MGLTIHYKLKHAGNETAARRLIEQLHQAAQDLPFKEVQDIVDLTGEACKFDNHDKESPLRWLLIQADASLKLDEHSWLGVPPTRIIAFETWPGEGCEAANFGLCQYPATIEHQGKIIRTKMSGWRWSSFCKTQYASDPACGGVENFLRCHLLVVALLDKAKELGCLDEAYDEGKFWENRDVKALVPEIESWNGMIAAFAGQLKDTLGEGVESPITNYSNFEQLELAGQSTLSPQTAELAKLIQQVLKKP
ncbi:MAG: hypothetical protein NTZ16_15110 [Verrucomicrobia bacterium]|nr:hypothetical protein [Verrucomicrobiota bacterium]